jgi:NAD(P)-dependent dehydrogenase (short-subunit alcohol dehydrogenase family)
MDHFDRTTSHTTTLFSTPSNQYFVCYGCGSRQITPHPVYVFSCQSCGQKNAKYRHFSANLAGQISIVIGTRTKLGHMVSLKLLRAGSTVIGTTRYPAQTLALFQQYDDSSNWIHNLDIYSEGLDLDCPNLTEVFDAFVNYLSNKYNHVTNFIFCAAQTIRVREKERSKTLSDAEERNRYGDAKFVHESHVNSWQMKIIHLTQCEMEECFRINAIAPALLFQRMYPLLRKSPNSPYFVSVHAREGNFTCEKGPSHPHTNMAKAALHMLTRCLAEAHLKTENGDEFAIHGCDPGWISVDEYYEDGRPWVVPPLDEIDGAARILFPIFAKLPTEVKSRKHFDELLY